MTLRSALLLSGALIVNACNEESRGKSNPVDSPKAGTAEDAAVERAPTTSIDLDLLLDRDIDNLDADETRALCEEGTRRVDPCREQARRATSVPEECEAVLAECRSGLEGYDPVLTCQESTPASPGTCGVTVGEYLACLDAFDQSLSCETAWLLVAPAACEPLVTQCPSLSPSFYLPGLPPGCTAEEAAGKPPDTTDDIYGHDGCRPMPARFVVLGDSIADCIGTSARERCAPNLIADHLRATVAPSLVFDTHATAGARTGDLPGQAAAIAGGPGHVFVWIYAVGNDLTSGDTDVAPWAASYEEAFAYFADAARFPDGATFLLNSQYRLDDECDPPGPRGPHAADLVALLLEANQRLFVDVAITRSDAVAVDQLPDFLGHGNNANVSGCPHCGPDNTAWITDGLHPNDAGHAHIAEKWIVALEGMFGTACGDAGTPPPP